MHSRQWWNCGLQSLCSHHAASDVGLLELKHEASQQSLKMMKSAMAWAVRVGPEVMWVRGAAVVPRGSLEGALTLELLDLRAQLEVAILPDCYQVRVGLVSYSCGAYGLLI